MKNFHPESWSKQARRMADSQYNQYTYYSTEPRFQCAADNIESADVNTYINFFSNSYRAPIIRTRAAKRFGRLLRKQSKAQSELV